MGNKGKSVATKIHPVSLQLLFSKIFHFFSNKYSLITLVVSEANFVYATQEFRRMPDAKVSFIFNCSCSFIQKRLSIIYVHGRECHRHAIAFYKRGHGDGETDHDQRAQDTGKAKEYMPTVSILFRFSRKM